jgi:phenylalanyl-tRNA synthetase beta chain
MLASTRWLRELCPLQASADEIARRLTAAGLEVEGRKRYGELPGVVIAEVRAKSPHPTKDKLTVVTLFDGERELSVVCGASNVPEAPGRVLLARTSARLPSGLEIAERKLGGVLSQGMICSEQELDIGSESDGIFVLGDDISAEPGTPVSEALALEDEVLEIGLTPNRPDCLGHVGLARELSALFGVGLSLPRAEGGVRWARPPAHVDGMRPVALFSRATGEGREITAVPVSVADAARCPRYAACVVSDVHVGPSPFWLRYRLHVLGLRAINNVVDITNWVLLEYGYPTHAFDLRRLRGGRIEVRTGRPGERVVTLDGMEHAVGEDDLLICDGAGPVAVAGVMGGEHSGVSADTQQVLVECAYFEPRGIRRTSRRLGLHTDSSHRFERGVDPRAVPGVMARVSSLLSTLAGGVASSHGFQVYPRPIAERQLVLRLSRVRALLGVSPTRSTIETVLSALGCAIQTGDEGTLQVRVPTWRPDLAREEDLIEEIARVWGYDNIPTQVPKVLAQAGTQPMTRLVRRVKERAAALGLTEVVNHAFISESQLRRAGVDADVVRLLNPLSEERAVMRPTLLVGLCGNLQRAQRHQVAEVQLFELARTFAPSDRPLPEERYTLAMLMAGRRTEWFGEGPEYDFHDGKGMLQSILHPLVRSSVETVVDDDLVRQHPYFHPRRAARARLGGEAVGVLGQLHPDIADVLELAGPVIYAEVDMHSVLDASDRQPTPTRKPLSKFPASNRDLALTVPETVQAGQMAAALQEAGGPLVEDVQLFDLYRGQHLDPDKKSLAFRIRYRDPEGTLTDERVDAAHAKLVAQAQKLFGAEVRA